MKNDRRARTAPSGEIPASETPRAQKDLSNLFAGRGSLTSRMDLGKQARKRMPRAKLAVCTLDKRDPVGPLEASNAGRVPELIPIRYGRMATASCGSGVYRRSCITSR